LPCFALLCLALPCFALLCLALPCFALLCLAFQVSREPLAVADIIDWWEGRVLMLVLAVFASRDKRLRY
jgi:hypothetical protein